MSGAPDRPRDRFRSMRDRNHAEPCKVGGSIACDTGNQGLWSAPRAMARARTGWLGLRRAPFCHQGHSCHDVDTCCPPQSSTRHRRTQNPVGPAPVSHLPVEGDTGQPPGRSELRIHKRCCSGPRPSTADTVRVPSHGKSGGFTAYWGQLTPSGPRRTRPPTRWCRRRQGSRHLTRR